MGQPAIDNVVLGEQMTLAQLIWHLQPMGLDRRMQLAYHFVSSRNDD
jgi:hypothetical protein